MTSPKPTPPAAIVAAEAPPRTRPSLYPPVFAARVAGRVKHPLGDLFGLHNFGMNLTRLPPGVESALFHRHTKQDELVYILQGRPTLVTDSGETELGPGMCAGFPAGGSAHQLVNRTTEDVIYLEVGDRVPNDEVEYPREDLKAVGAGPGGWRMLHKDGTPY
jgi:uncharacterized cupin superfamily protein